MPAPSVRSVLLLMLALVFTVGLTFAAIELPYIVDGYLQNHLTTPGFDSSADATSRLKTELFIQHYHLRTIGYACFTLTIILILLGFATRRSGAAAIGAFAFMLPVFAQFAGVMFFLAGLGILNVLWLPVLDISFQLQGLGSIIRAPYDLIMWTGRHIGVQLYWPFVTFCIGGGLLIFFLGTWAWLNARVRERGVADTWVYRMSRHPQYLGWIIWSYGMYLLLMQQRYPKRSWGIDASLPWLLSTMVIIGVALLEELHMQRRFGESYAEFRRSRPFMFPLPRFVRWLFALPFRMFYHKNQPERRREVVGVLSCYSVLLIVLSVLFYSGGWAAVRDFTASPEQRGARIAEIAIVIHDHPNWRVKYQYADKLIAYGDNAIDPFVRLLHDEQGNVRAIAAQYLGELRAQRAIPDLIAALEDWNDDVRGRAIGSLARLHAIEAAVAIRVCMDDPEDWVRRTAALTLAEFGVQEILDDLILGAQRPEWYARIAYIDALGVLGSAHGLPVLIERLNDPEAAVRRAAVIALMRIGSPDAIPGLEGAARDVDWEVRVYAAEALRCLPK